MRKIDKKSLFHDCFYANIIMIIPIVNIIYLGYLIYKKDKRKTSIALAMFITKTIVVCSITAAFYTLYKTHPEKFEAFKQFTQNDTHTSVVDVKGYLEVGGIMLQISSEEGMVLSYDAKKVVLYSPDKHTNLVMYQDSGIKVGSLSDEELANMLVIENPADYFDEYEEQHFNIAEKIGIADKSCYVTYTQGPYKIINENGNIEEDSAYTELYIFQDIGAETYLSIRVADYTGEAPLTLLTKYTLSMINQIS